MRRKLSLIWRAAKAGASWAWAWSDHAGRAFLFYALLLGSGGISVAEFGWEGPVVAIAAFSLFALSMGGLNEWDKAEHRVETNERFQGAMVAFEGRCNDHIAQVERFLAARDVRRPQAPRSFAQALREVGTPQDARNREEAARHERETVAAFIESDHLDRGVRLIDILIEGGFVNEGTREHVADPRTEAQIRDGLDSIRWGADHLPIFR